MARIRRNVNILLVEDNPDDKDLTSRDLAHYTSNYDWKIEHAPYLNKAIELLKSETYELIILDLHLPESTGVETLHKLKEAIYIPLPPVIVLTGAQDLDTVKSFKWESISSYLVKGGYNKERLINEITSALENFDNFEDIFSERNDQK